MEKLVKKNLVLSRFGLLLLLLITVIVDDGLATPDWFVSLSKVTVLTSKRSDVEAAFSGIRRVESSNDDSRSKGWGEIVTYETADGELVVFYSTGNCKQTDDKVSWDFPKDSVFSIRFEPSRDYSLKQLPIKLDSFKGHPSSDFPSTTYRSEALGITIVTDGDRISEYGLFYPSKQLRRLKC
jgi:hypothetical protein